MTLEELFDCSVDTLEKLSDAELLEIFKPYLDVTRPDKARAKQKQPTQPSLAYMSPAKKATVEKLKEMGIDLDFLGKKRYKGKF